MIRALLARLGERALDQRLRLASAQADGLLAVLGLVSGVAAGLVIVAFRLTIGALQQVYMAELPGDAFEWLGEQAQFLAPALGGLVLGALYWRLPAAARTVGVVHVLERLHYHQGHLPLRNLLVQFFGGAVALASGQSVGREAPSVHLGAAVASLFGRQLGLPNNSLRTLVACGAAAAIAASFNTPLAGVVFAMEVVMVEYTIAGFVPVILAAVAATAVTRFAFGDETAFLVPLLGLASLWELAYITLMGVLIGVVAAAFIKAVRVLTALADHLPVPLRMVAAGAAVGLIALATPQVLGLGYDTVSQVLGGGLALGLVLGVLAAKFVASALCCAARMPGGLIGPTVVMGSLLGAAFAEVASLFPGVSSQAALFAMLGMGAMMGAVLQAPLAALLALLEMTGNPLLIMPAMLAVVAASLTARLAFGQDSVFTLMMRDAGLDYRHDPLSQGLRRVGVAAVMNRSFEHAERRLDADAARELLKRGPQWIIVERDVERPILLRAADLARHCESAAGTDTAGEIDLLLIPAAREELKPVHLEASLFEAREIMQREGVEALYVRRPLAPMTFRTFGVVRRADVESGYAFRA
ncbi:MAG: chloride channel protein [Gammaproteobacteria bacterium]